MASQQKLRQYFDRVGLPFPESPTPSLDLLNQLIRAHLEHVPFENTFMHMKGKSVNVPASLGYDGDNTTYSGVEPLFEKFVVQRRGGYCFEQHALFGWVLQELGYKCQTLKAFIRMGDYRPSATHALLLVHVEPTTNPTPYLVDVGFGDSPGSAIRFTGHDHVSVFNAPFYAKEQWIRVQPCANNRFSVSWYCETEDDLHGWPLSPGEALPLWYPKYAFSIEDKWTPGSLQAGIAAVAAEDNIFNSYVAVLLKSSTKERIVLVDKTLTITKLDPETNSEERGLLELSDAGTAEALATKFGIPIDDGSGPVAAVKKQPRSSAVHQGFKWQWLVYVSALAAGVMVATSVLSRRKK